MWLKFRSYNVPTENYAILNSLLKIAGNKHITTIGLKDLLEPENPAPIRAIAENIFSNYKEHDCNSAFLMIIKPKNGKHIDYHICRVRKNGIACIRDTLQILEGEFIHQETKKDWNIGRFSLFNKFSEIEKRNQAPTNKQVDLIYFEKNTPNILQGSISGVI